MRKRRIPVYLMTVACLFILQYPLIAESAKRTDVLEALDAIPVDWENAGLTISVNDRSDDPDVVVGDELTYKVHSAEPGYFTIVHIDSHGAVSMILPGQGDADAKPLTDIAYPSEGTLKAAPPLGQETLFAVMTDVPLDYSTLKVEPGSDFVQSDDSLELVSRLKNILSNQPGVSKIAVSKLQYLVEGEPGTTQYTTRSIIRTFVDDQSEKSESSENTAVMKSFRNIEFDFNSATLKPQGKMELDGIGGALNHQKTKGMRFVLAGHTDDIGPTEYNMMLSKDRAQAVMDYLAEMHGIDEQRLSVRAAGESEPVTPNVDKASRAMNRRVELILIDE